MLKLGFKIQKLKKKEAPTVGRAVPGPPCRWRRVPPAPAPQRSTRRRRNGRVLACRGRASRAFSGPRPCSACLRVPSRASRAAAGRGPPRAVACRRTARFLACRAGPAHMPQLGPGHEHGRAACRHGTISRGPGRAWAVPFSACLGPARLASYSVEVK